MSDTWRGVSVDSRTRQMLDAVAELVPDIDLHPLQGSWSGSVGASAGTHSGAGAVDLDARHLDADGRSRLATAMRQVGFAAWVRGPDSWAGRFDIWHVHGIAVAADGLSDAAGEQVDDYRDGRDGLARKGPDYHTRAYVNRTWEDYQQLAGGDDMPISDEDAQRIAWAVWSFNQGSMGGTSAAARLTAIGDGIAGIPSKVWNYKLPVAGGGAADAWTLLRAVYDKVVGG
jgi:hypothetical protein